jgi:hypothetical protein
LYRLETDEENEVARIAAFAALQNRRIRVSAMCDSAGD